MRLILSEILTLRQHLNTLKQNPELYCPNACIYCQETAIWRYGYYYRKPDRLNQGDESQNDIPIPRFQCVACRRTFSTLPECIAPRRWYPWAIQQACLWLSLSGWSIRSIHQLFPAARSTLSRWVSWLGDNFTVHHRVLCGKDATLGYYSELTSFWLHWIDLKSLPHAMALLNQEGVIVP
jgi:transposase-like protein